MNANKQDAGGLPNELGFEQWYVTNTFDYPSNPLGSRDCSIARKAWHAALDAIRNGEQCRAASGEVVAWIRSDGVTTSDAGLMRHWEAQGLQFAPLLRALSRGVPEDDPDGVRYRWLFSTDREDPAWPQSVEDAIDCLSKGAVDAAIDAAIAAQRKEG